MSLTHAATHLATRRTGLTAAAGLTALAAGAWWVRVSDERGTDLAAFRLMPHGA